MWKSLRRPRRLFGWVALFTATLVLAVSLANVLATSEPVSFSQPTQPPTQPKPFPVVTSPATLELQSKYDRTFAQYATVSRSDGSFRNMFIEAESLRAVEPGQPLPDGTLILMETWYSPESLGSVFIKEKRDGVWQYGSFSPSQPDYQLGANASCHSCHVPFRETDFTLTLPLLQKALQTRQVQTAFCDRAGRTPCPAEVYVPAQS